MPIKHTLKYGVYHWDTFDNETLFVGESNNLEGAKKIVEDKYARGLQGADRVDLVDSRGNILWCHGVGARSSDAEDQQALASFPTDLLEEPYVDDPIIPPVPDEAWAEDDERTSLDIEAHALESAARMIADKGFGQLAAKLDSMGFQGLAGNVLASGRRAAERDAVRSVTRAPVETIEDPSALRTAAYVLGTMAVEEEGRLDKEVFQANLTDLEDAIESYYGDVPAEFPPAPKRPDPILRDTVSRILRAGGFGVESSALATAIAVACAMVSGDEDDDRCPLGCQDGTNQDGSPCAIHMRGR